MLRVSHQLTQELGREPTMDELGDALKVTAKKVESIIQIARRPLSLETPTDEEDDSVLGDFIEDEDSPEPVEIATHNLLKEQIAEVLNGLPPREVRILQLRYGLLDGESYTLEEVGKKMGVTRERVRQIEAQASAACGIPPTAANSETTCANSIQQTARHTGRSFLFAVGSWRFGIFRPLL